MSEVFTLYKIEFPNSKLYFGITSKSVQKRLMYHFYYAFNLFSRYPVHCAMRKYGKENVKIISLETGTREYISELEIKTILNFKTQDRNFGYNIEPGGIGTVVSAETRQKISIANKGLKRSEETRERLRNRIFTAETREKMRNKIVSNETRKRMSLARIGKKHSEETKQKLSKSLKGIPLSEQHKRGISLGQTGRKLSEETKLKISLTLKARNAESRRSAKNALAHEENNNGKST